MKDIKHKLQNLIELNRPEFNYKWKNHLRNSCDDCHYDKINNNNSKCSINSCNNREQTTNSLKLNVNDESFLNRKKEGKIKIYFYVENLINLIVNHKEYNEVNTGEGYLKGYIKTFNWEYFFFKGDISEEKNKLISKLLKEDYIYKDFNDIIIVTVDKLLDEKSKLFFSHFEKDSLQMSSQPLILFLTRKEENPKIEELYSLITNYYFDKRNIYAIKFPSLNKNEKEIKLMLDFVNRGVSYYHGIGDLYDSINEDILSNYKLNILMCGRAGTGKSSFVNKFLKEKRAKEGEGLSQTQNIIRFTHPNYPLTIYDTPGFENEETVENVRKLLNQYNKILYDARKKINLILYFFIYNERSVMSMEVPLLKELIKYDAEIIFVMNFVTDSIEKSNYKRIYDIYKNSLTNIYKDVKDFDIKIIPINIYPKLDDDAEEIIIKRPAFGIDVLFNTVYNIFKPLIVDIKELDKIKYVEQLFSFL
jgi:GTP-binding protein EngB required for normal cell division